MAAFRKQRWCGAVAAMIAGLILTAPAWGQLGPADNTQPVNIQADNGIEWQQDQQLYIAHGNAVATRGPASIKADTLTAHYREAKSGTPNAQGNTEIYRVEAQGNVVITRDNRAVVGDRADYDIDRGIGIVTGHALKMTTAQDTVTARDALEWYDQKQIAVARGDAVAVHNGRTIKADVLTAYMVKDTQAQPRTPGHPQPPKPAPAPAKPIATMTAAAPGNPAVKPAAAGAQAGTAASGTLPGQSNEASKIDRVDAQGHVVVIGAADIGRGDYGVYNAATGICTLMGNVVITRGKDVITGQYAVMDMNRNISRILPASTLPGGVRQRVQGVFVKQDAQGGAGEPGKSGAAKTPANSPTPAPAARKQ
jgi:lipopolysaccharide export system protein LptA